MSKRLVAIMLACLPLAANAEPAAPAADSPASTEAPAKKPAQCAAVTGSRIRPNVSRGCDAPKPYRRYSAEELQRSGDINMAEALRKLDPIFH